MAGVLSACSAMEAPAITDCEDRIKRDLRSPSTYKRIKADTTDMRDERQIWVSVEYDAANAYGTPIRDSRICKYPSRNGSADVLNYVDDEADIEAVADNMEVAADNMEVGM